MCHCAFVLVLQSAQVKHIILAEVLHSWYLRVVNCINQFFGCHLTCTIDDRDLENTCVMNTDFMLYG